MIIPSQVPPVAMLLGLCCSAVSQARFTELLRMRPPSTSMNGGYAARDLDNDGDPDLLASCIWVYLRNEGDGSFVDVSSTHMPYPGPCGRKIVVEDFDADGWLDVFTPVPVPSDRDYLFLNDGTGRLVDVSHRLPRRTITGRHGTAAAGDVDGDGDLDVVVGSWYWLGVNPENYVWLNDGNGNFTDGGQVWPWVGDVDVLEAADLDRDGDVDFVSGGIGYIGIHMNFGGVSFGSRYLTTTAGLGLAVDDVNGDGAHDIIRGGTVLLLNDGLGGFIDVSATHLPRPASPSFLGDVTLIDYEGDGDLDLVSAPGGPTKLVNVAVYENDGRGFFRDISEYGPDRTSTSASALVADYDLDGDPDVAVTTSNPNYHTPRILQNLHRHLEAPAAPTPGGAYRLNVHAAFGTAALVAVGGAEGRFSLPPFGLFRLDPARSAVLPGLNLTQQPWVTIPVPNVPSLIGLPVLSQALIIDLAQPANNRFTNLWRDVVR